MALSQYPLLAMGLVIELYSAGELGAVLSDKGRGSGVWEIGLGPELKLGPGPVSGPASVFLTG